jgi:hypothetical protein
MDIVAHVQRFFRSHAQPLERTLEDRRLRLADTDIVRGEHEREVTRELDDIDLVALRVAGAVGDDGERQMAQRVEAGQDVGVEVVGLVAIAVVEPDGGIDQRIMTERDSFEGALPEETADLLAIQRAVGGPGTGTVVLIPEAVVDLDVGIAQSRRIEIRRERCQRVTNRQDGGLKRGLIIYKRPVQVDEDGSQRPSGSFFGQAMLAAPAVWSGMRK